MPLASHHVSFTEHRGKIYAFGGFVLPQSGPPAWVPIDNAWEYDPANDSWRARADADAAQRDGGGRASRPTTRRRTPGACCRRCPPRATASPALSWRTASTW